MGWDEKRERHPLLRVEKAHRRPPTHRHCSPDSLGTSRRRTSSVTVPTSTAVLVSLFFMYRARRERERGARLVLDIYSRFSTTLAKALSVLRARNLNSFTSSPRYTLSDLGDVRTLCPTRRPPATRSIPMLLRAGKAHGCDRARPQNWGTVWRLVKQEFIQNMEACLCVWSPRLAEICGPAERCLRFKLPSVSPSTCMGGSVISGIHLALLTLMWLNDS